MNWINKHQAELLHLSLTLIGGISGAYALMVRENFGSAQTGNLIELIIGFSSNDFFDTFLRILILFLYVFSLIAARLLALFFPKKNRQICLIAEVLCILSAGMFPSGANPLLALCPVFILSTLQWQTFTEAQYYNSSTLFSTNNLKQFVLAWLHYNIFHKAEDRQKALFFTRTLLVFHLGILIGFYAVQLWSEKAIWLALLPAACAFLFTQKLGCNSAEL